MMGTKKYPEGPPLDYFTDLGNYSPAVAAAGRNKYILCCGTGPVDSDQPDINQGWALANHSLRQSIIKAHTYYLQGSLYFLGNDINVPEFTRKDVGRFGLCADEFVEFGNWPPQLYHSRKCASHRGRGDDPKQPDSPTKQKRFGLYGMLGAGPTHYVPICSSSAKG